MKFHDHSSVNRAMIDVHAHLFALPEAGNGCYVSAKAFKNPILRFLAWKEGLDLTRPEAANAAYISGLLARLEKSARVKQAVLLGIDGVYDARGELDTGRTHFLVANSYVLEVAARHPGYFLPGVSINPRRRDALDEIERCAERGAVLVKILPNTQGFDPSDRRYLPFYRSLAKHRLPLLSHVGLEFALMGKDQSAGDPRRLRLGLEEGVCVIAAHGCSYGLFFFEPYAKIFLDLARRYPNFYADTSALTLPNRVRTLFLLRRRPELFERLIFGTDYPLPVFSYPALGNNFTAAARTTNPFDRQATVLESLSIRWIDFSALTAKMASTRPPH